MNILCKIGNHKTVWDATWYYEPERYCVRCGFYDVTSWREKYVLWSSMHSLNPIAWPWVIYQSILIWWYNRAQKD